MLKTNSKKACENIRRYIMENFDGCNYGLEAPEDFTTTAKYIFDIFRSEESAEGGYNHMSEATRFESWAQGLPSILDTCYYYNRSAVDDLAMILEETEAEKSRYTEEKAEKILTSLIYREIKKVGG